MASGTNLQMKRNRPPWWDENTPFPPEGNWHPNRRRFMWRFGFLFLLLALLACGAFTLLFWILALSFSQPNLPPAFNLVRPLGLGAFLIALVILAFTIRAFRRAVEPVGEVIDAAQRVADGDYTTRVQERGPREVRGLTRAFNAMTARLQSNDAQRRRLLADVSHELRTPLSVIQGNLEGMLDGVYPLDRTHLEPVLDETRQLSLLIEDLSTLALAESGALQLRKESTDLAILVHETVASFRAQAASAGITLAADTAQNLPGVLLDPARIRQVLENLLANALRYTPRGGEVKVTCAVGTKSNVWIAVKDTGRGISPEALPHIFERFYKEQDSRGTGLGLAIAASLVQSHGGTISAESIPGQGTTIRFEIPVE